MNVVLRLLGLSSILIGLREGVCVTRIVSTLFTRRSHLSCPLLLPVTIAASCYVHEQFESLITVKVEGRVRAELIMRLREGGLAVCLEVVDLG